MEPITISSPLRILLVEDNEHDRLAFRRAFEKAQAAYEITECVRAEDALERLRADASSFDLVVVDHGWLACPVWIYARNFSMNRFPCRWSF